MTQCSIITVSSYRYTHRHTPLHTATHTVTGLGAEYLPILEYAVLFRDSVGTHVATGSVGGTTYALGGLRTGGEYRFLLRAHNARGWSVAGSRCM